MSEVELVLTSSLRFSVRCVLSSTAPGMIL